DRRIAAAGAARDPSPADRGPARRLINRWRSSPPAGPDVAAGTHTPSAVWWIPAPGARPPSSGQSRPRWPAGNTSRPAVVVGLARRFRTLADRSGTVTKAQPDYDLGRPSPIVHTAQRAPSDGLSR